MDDYDDLDAYDVDEPKRADYLDRLDDRRDIARGK